MKKLKKQSESSLFLSIAGKDERVVRLLKITSKGNYLIDTNTMLKDLHQLHVTRAHREILPQNLMKQTRKTVMEWVAENNAYRGRAVSIMMRCVEIQMKLQKRINDMRNYLGAEYGGYLKREFSTEAGKKRAVDTIIEPMLKKTQEIETVLAVARLLIEDLDKSAWNVSYVNEISKIEFQHERNV